MSTSAAPSGFDPPPRPAPPESDDGLVFVVHDVRSRRGPEPPAPPADASASPAADDGFVIREPNGSGPVIPLDALVVGAATPAGPAPEPRPTAGFSVISAPPAAAPGPKAGFRVHTMAVTTGEPAQAAPEQLPWTVRERVTPPAPTRGWSPRRSELVERSTADTVRRLREEAVTLSWKAASIAITAADSRLYRARGW